ncbi:hypothetical protein NC651_026952 [Populus alba x Populus x berolinensis]|nr:hypothetical protein NC651_026952 [Populus alba x Populus x berolinensis]
MMQQAGGQFKRQPSNPQHLSLLVFVKFTCCAACSSESSGCPEVVVGKCKLSRILYFPLLFYWFSG